MTDTSHFGPLAQLVGEWEGEKGLDVSYHHADEQVGETPYRETITFKPFGPVDNGTQQLYGLDYKMAAWRIGEDLSFHTEVGYWLWCGGLSHVMRGFVIPRGSAILAGGEVAPDATSFTLRAEVDSDVYGITQNPYLFEKARCIAYEVNISVDDDELTYDETTTLQMTEFDEPFAHTDRNVMRRMAELEVPV
ncbi:MAG: FABP family protein [Actinomycetia bacterium]|nr:FABP family protein [Actinomycetes bacterium]MCP4086501.1 FABP family protein [Actinomycetes bacterium]